MRRTREKIGVFRPGNDNLTRDLHYPDFMPTPDTEVLGFGIREQN